MVYVKRVFQFLTSSAFLGLVIIGNGFLLLIITAVYLLEHQVNPNLDDYFDAIWWGVTTITTVGYGDIVPVTFWARVLGVVLMYTGTVLFIAFTSMVAAYLVRGEVSRKLGPVEEEVREEMIETEKVERMLKRINERLDRLEKKK